MVEPVRWLEVKVSGMLQLVTQAVDAQRIRPQKVVRCCREDLCPDSVCIPADFPVSRLCAHAGVHGPVSAAQPPSDFAFVTGGGQASFLSGSVRSRTHDLGWKARERLGSLDAHLPGTTAASARRVIFSTPRCFLSVEDHEFFFPPVLTPAGNTAFS